MKELGETLKKKRLEKKLSVMRVSDILRIRHNYIEMIEAGDYSLDSVYLVGYIKNYANFLKVDIEQHLEDIGEQNNKESKRFDSREEIVLDSSSPPLMLVAIIVITIILSAGGLIILKDYQFGDRDTSKIDDQVDVINSFDKSEVKLPPVVEVVNSFQINITNLHKDTKIIIEALQPVEVSIFEKNGDLLVRERLAQGQKTTIVNSKNSKFLKFITNAPKAVQLTFE